MTAQRGESAQQGHFERELREAIAEALCRHEFGAEFLDEQTPEWQVHFREGADAILALPEVAPLVTLHQEGERARRDIAALRTLDGTL